MTDLRAYHRRIGVVTGLAERHDPDMLTSRARQIARTGFASKSPLRGEFRGSSGNLEAAGSVGQDGAGSARGGGRGSVLQGDSHPSGQPRIKEPRLLVQVEHLQGLPEPLLGRLHLENVGDCLLRVLR